jgi:hypothetical protein
MTTPPTFRHHLRMLLGDGHAHMGFDAAVADFPAEAMNTPVPNAPYTPWHILEHMRRTQRDSLDYMLREDYTAPAWPDDFWPARDATTDAAGWQETLDAFRADLAEYVRIATDETIDLGTPIPTNPAHDYLRSIFIIAAHNHHHLGEFAALRQVMGTWPPDHEA